MQSLLTRTMGVFLAVRRSAPFASVCHLAKALAARIKDNPNERLMTTVEYFSVNDAIS